MTTTTLPEIKIVDLPALDDEVPCMVQVDGELCGKPSTWRLSMTCCGCGARLHEVMSGHCRMLLLSVGFPVTATAEATTTCCRASVRDVSWSRL